MDTGLDPSLATVVVVARNEERFIADCLRSITAQKFDNLQIIVVDGASTDRTAEIVREFAESDPRIELLHNPKAIVPSSLNVALAAARGVWLVRVDAHAAVPPDYVARAVEHLRTGRWGGVGGRKDAVGHTPAGRAVAAAMASRFGVGNSTYHYGTEEQVVDHVPFGAYPTALARELGGWDERLAVNQDFEFDYRIRASGRQLLFDPALTIGWYCRQSIGDLFAQYHRYGRGKARVAVLHPDSLSPRHLAAPALVGSWAVAGLTARRRPLLSALAFVPYLVALALASLSTARRVTDPRARPYVPAAFVAMHAGWGTGYWRGLARLAVERIAQRSGGNG